MIRFVFIICTLALLSPARTFPNTLIKTPTIRTALNETPSLLDDLNFKGIDLAIKRQLARFKEINPKRKVQFGKDIYHFSDYARGLKLFQRIYRTYQLCTNEIKPLIWQCQIEFQQKIMSAFNIYEPSLTPNDPRHNQKKSTFFTGYYTTHINASMVKTKRFKYAVYARPKEEKLRRLTRHEIDFQGKLSGKGYELFYSDDLFELWLLHVEGGGKAVFQDGSTKDFYLSFDGTNQRKFTFLVTYMKEKGMLKDDFSIDAQKAYLEKHPEVWEEVYASSPSYVYFYPSEEPPIGNDAVSLTDNRSIATDRFLYKQKGGLAFIKTTRVDPKSKKESGLQFMEFSRFVLDQDTGGAIRGKARVDIYFGEGDYAKLASYNQEALGNIYFLMPKP